jgi:hypothetical protein
VAWASGVEEMLSTTGASLFTPDILIWLGGRCKDGGRGDVDVWMVKGEKGSPL